MGATLFFSRSPFMKVLVSLSGGKNSVRACFAYLEKGVSFDTLTYIPYFDDKIPLISSEHYNFLFELLSYLRSKGVTCHIVKGISYYAYCSRVLTKGENKGKRRGFPLFLVGRCGFAQDSKIKSLTKFFKENSNTYDFVDIGLCADELDRHKITGKERSILQELAITDLECFYWCREHGWLSPKYKKSGRDGCVLCPHANVSERVDWYNSFPEVISKLKELQRISKENGYYPLRGKHWFIENDEFQCGYGGNCSLFDEMYY